MELLTTFLVILGAFLVAFLMINIRYIFKGEPFRGTCAQNNAKLKNEFGECSVCGRKPEEECQMPKVQEG
jgi:hypothetical protein